MQRTLLFALLMGSMTMLSAQSIEELTLVQNARNDTTAFQQLLLHSFNLKEQDSLRADQLAQEAIQIAQQTFNTRQLVQSRLNYARILIHHLQVDSALVHLEIALEQFEPDAIDTLLAKVYIELDNAWYKRMSYRLATQYNFQALRIYEALEMRKEQAQRLARIGLLLILQESYEEGVDYCQQAITIQKELEAMEDMGTSYVNMARGYLFTPDFDKAVASANKAVELYETYSSDSTLMADSYNTRGNVLKYLERYEEAEADYRWNLAYSERHDNIPGLIASNGNLGHVLRLQEKYEEALVHTLKAIELIEESGERRNLWENYLHASIEYEMLGDFKKSLEYNILFSEERERLHEEATEHLKSELQIQYETDKKDTTIAGQEAQITQQRRIQSLAFGIVALLLIIALVIYFAYRKNQRITQQLVRRNQENELLLKEIHHRVKNNLQVISSLLSLQSSQIQDDTVLDAMRESQNRVRSMALIHQKLYQGENLAGVEMKDYLATLGKSVLSSFGVKPDTIQVKTLMEEIELDVDHAIPVGLIVNELVTNSIKYAFPDKEEGEIQISLERSADEELQLVVADSGVGADKDATPQGTGFGSQLVNLLTLQLNGKLETEQEKGMKTILRFKPKNAA